MASSYSRIQTRRFWASSRCICIRFVLPRGSCGERTPGRAILFALICGIVISIMPELQPDRDQLVSLPSLPRDEGGPVFAEPWQAQAFALAVRLSVQGYFTWKEWATVLADELKSAADRGHADDGSSYYE